MLIAASGSDELKQMVCMHADKGPTIMRQSYRSGNYIVGVIILHLCVLFLGGRYFKYGNTHRHSPPSRLTTLCPCLLRRTSTFATSLISEQSSLDSKTLVQPHTPKTLKVRQSFSVKRN